MTEFSIEFPREGPVPDDIGSRLLAGMTERQERCLHIYRLLRQAGQLERRRLLAYRCPRRCLLLDVFPTPYGPGVFLPAFRLSPEQNMDTSPQARAERTTDGDRRWVERADVLMAAPACPTTSPATTYAPKSSLRRSSGFSTRHWCADQRSPWTACTSLSRTAPRMECETRSLAPGATRMGTPSHARKTSG